MRVKPPGMTGGPPKASRDDARPVKARAAAATGAKAPAATKVSLVGLLAPAPGRVATGIHAASRGLAKAVGFDAERVDALLARRKGGRRSKRSRQE